MDAQPDRPRRTAVRAAAVVAALLGVAHVLFGLANVQPGFPVLEGVAATVAGLALLAAAGVVLRSVRAALVLALAGTSVLAAWFAYGVFVQGSSDPQFSWWSLVIPPASAVALLASRRSR